LYRNGKEFGALDFYQDKEIVKKIKLIDKNNFLVLLSKF
jgi:hypothetical protein